MSRKLLIGLIALCVVLVVWAVMFSRGSRYEGTTGEPVAYKAPKKIGILQVTAILDTVVDGLKVGLQELGYAEGKDVVYVYRNWEHDPSKIEGMTKELVDGSVDIVLGIGAPAVIIPVEYTKKVGKSIPIIYTLVDHPDEIGLIKSFKSSGNSVTGIASNFDLLVPLQLDFLKRISPNTKKLGLFTDGFKIPKGPGDFVLAALQKHAPEFGITLVEYKTTVLPGPELKKAWMDIANRIKPGEIDATYHIPGHFVDGQDAEEVRLGLRLKAISVMPIREETEASKGSFAYGPDSFEIGKQAAVMADKIFRGIKPTDIPSEYPRKNTLVVNLKNAAEIGITIPDSVLAITDVKLR